MVPNNLYDILNRLTGILLVFVLLLLFLTKVNRTRFLLELGCSLHQNRVGRVTFKDATIVFMLRLLPISMQNRLTSPRHS